MTLDEAQDLRRRTESDILAAIRSFEAQTGLTIRAIDLTQVTEMGKRARATVEVNARVEL